MAKVVDPLD
jgi:hypothetical protein